MRNQRSLGLDLLRIFACSLVLLFHWSTFPGRYWNFTFPPLRVPGLECFASRGELGVDIFFIISGIVIAQSAINRSFSDFMRARFLRIYPGLFVSSIITIPILCSRPNQTWTLMKYNIFSGFFSSTGIQTISHIFFNRVENYIPATWTLCVEIQFYFVVAFSILIFRNLTENKLYYFAYLSLLLTVTFQGGYNFSSYFIFGIFISLVKNYKNLLFCAPGIFVSGYFMLEEINRREQHSLSLYYVEPLTKNSHPSFFNFGLILMVVFFAFLKNPRILKTKPIARFIKTLSLMTYPIYLLHETAGMVVIEILYRSGLSPNLSYLISFLSVMFTSWVTVNYFEPFFRDLFEKVRLRISRTK